MKKILSVILLLAFISQTFNRGLILLDYAINRSYYEAHCENRYIPSMHCCGRCLLKKRLQQEEKNEAQDLQRSNKNEVVCSHSFVTTIPEPSAIANNVSYSAYQSGNILNRPRSFFHPPGA